MSHSNLSHIIDVCNIWNSNDHRVKIVNIMGSTGLIQNINWRGSFSMVINSLLIIQPFIKLLDLWVNCILVNKLSILIGCGSLAIILIATIRKTSYMISVIKELLMCLLGCVV